MKRFNIVSNGYDIGEVNRFIDVVITRLDKLNKDNERYVRQISELELKVKENSSVDDKLSKALLTVQETSDRMKQLAKEEATMIIDEAKRNANAIVHEALVEAGKTEMQASLLKKNITVYKTRVTNILKAQLDIAEELDKIDLDSQI